MSTHVKEEKKSKKVENQKQSWDNEMGKGSKMHTAEMGREQVCQTDVKGSPMNTGEMGMGSKMHTAEMGKEKVCQTDVGKGSPMRTGEMGKESKMHTGDMGKMHTGEMGKGYQMSGNTESKMHTGDMGKMHTGEMEMHEMGKGSQMHTGDMGKESKMHTGEMGSKMHTGEMGKESKMHKGDMGKMHTGDMGKESKMHTGEMGSKMHTGEMGKESKMHTGDMGKMHTGEMGKGYQMSGNTEMGPGCVPMTEMGKGSQMHTGEMGMGSQMHEMGSGYGSSEMGKGMQAPQVAPTGGMGQMHEMGPGCVPQTHTSELDKARQMHEMGPGYHVPVAQSEMGSGYGSHMHPYEMGKGSQIPGYCVPETQTSELEKARQMHEMGPGYHVPVAQSDMGSGYVPQTNTSEMGKGMHGTQVSPMGGSLYSIRNDHTLFRSNFDSLLNVTDLKTKLGIFNETIKKCSQYDVAEEVVLYSTIKNLGLSRVADTALEQTKHFEKLLYDMDHKYGGGITDNNCFNEDLTRLRDALNLHITLEENEIFPSLENHLASDDIESINKWFDRIKTMAPTRPHPSGPHSTAGKLLTGPVLSFVDRFRDLGKQFIKTP